MNRYFILGAIGWCCCIGVVTELAHEDTIKTGAIGYVAYRAESRALEQYWPRRALCPCESK